MAQRRAVQAGVRGVRRAVTSRIQPQFRYFLAGHTNSMAVATAVVNGRPVAITGDDDGTVRVRDLGSGRETGKPLRGHTGRVVG
ncbi:hypothetical protein, partial [Priestia megaterium]|uniref:hypothetical protein n=1 Tax=Priestia megaterium TaxID=1404 RepID=UPI0036D9578F